MLTANWSVDITSEVKLRKLCVQVTKHISQESILALKSRKDIDRSPKKEYR